MAAKKKSKAKKAKAKKTTKKVVKKSKPAKKAKKTKVAKKAKRKAPGILARAIKAVKKAVTPAKKKKAKNQVVGEGDYAAGRKYDADQQAFVKKNKGKITDLAKDAEKALEGPEGDSLRAAEAEGLGHSRDTFDA